MSYTKKEFKVLSSNGIHNLSGVVYLPEGEKKGFFHIVHGMTEYIGKANDVLLPVSYRTFSRIYVDKIYLG